MNNFKDGGFKKRGKNFGERGTFKGDRGGFKKGGNGRFRGGDRGGRDNSQAVSFSAVCSECRKNCTVPFKPNGEKPVFCSACFGMKKEGRPREERFVPRQDSYGAKKSYEAGRSVPTPLQKATPNADIEELKQQLIKIENRLNRILDIINPPKPPTKAVLAEVETPKVPEKKLAKAKTPKVATEKPRKVVKKVAKKK